jgi:arginyl-tRNA synthetase
LEKYLVFLFKKLSAKLSYLNEVDLTFDIPSVQTHGDFSSNAAMLLAKNLKRKPREIAEEIISNLDYESDVIEKVEIAGPGFINFFFKPSYLPVIIKEILDRKEEFGKSDRNKGKKANVEFVSANPTGPLTVGHGRNAVLGDTVANLLEWTGYEVDREYYFNNAGRQMRVLGDSVKKRYLHFAGKDEDFPVDYYQGEYIKDIAEKLFREHGDKLADHDPEGIFKEAAEAEIFEQIKATLLRLGIKHKIFFNEKSLYETGKIDSLLEELSEKEFSYEKDGAIWLKLQQMGSDQDKVIVKSTGEPTYRLPDIAYHIDKFKREYHLMIDVFGSDHTDTYPDVLAGLKALGFDSSKVVVLIHQFVTIMENGEIVKMSTRKANYITIDELIDKTGNDVVRYFFNMRNRNTHMNFDLTLIKKQIEENPEDNPVFYLQYAHARICSIIKMTKEQDLDPSVENLELLSTPEELALLKKLHDFESMVTRSAENYEPSILCVYLEELATAYHRFHKFRRIIGSEKKLAEARLALVIAVRTVLKNGLDILGVNAPERM